MNNNKYSNNNNNVIKIYKLTIKLLLINYINYITIKIILYNNYIYFLWLTLEFVTVKY